MSLRRSEGGLGGRGYCWRILGLSPLCHNLIALIHPAVGVSPVRFTPMNKELGRRFTPDEGSVEQLNEGAVLNLPGTEPKVLSMLHLP
jgi:hypothetical protein